MINKKLLGEVFLKFKKKIFFAAQRYIFLINI